MTIDETTGYRRGASPKDRWHRKHKKMLKEAVKSLGLDPERVHSNKGGPAVGGEVVYSDSCRALIILDCPINGHGEPQCFFHRQIGYCRRCSPEDKDGSYFPNQTIWSPSDGGDHTAASLAEILRKLLGI